MNRYLPFAGIILFCGTAVHATPVVTAVNGTVADNQVVTIQGSGFGTNSLRQNWLGGSSGPIDASANGTRVDSLNLAGWSLLQPSTATFPHVSTERGWSNGKSIAFDTRNTSEYKQTLFYDTGGSYSTLYTNSLIYLQHDPLNSNARLQWKMMRWTRTQTVVDGDGAMISNWPGNMSYFSYYNSSGQTTRWFGENGLDPLPLRGTWYRYETWVKFNSSPGAANGVFHIKVTNPANGSVVVDNKLTDVPYNGSGQSGNFRYLVLQNYFGNASDGGSGQKDNANAVAWWDDIYVSQSEARVEVCSEATWSACTNREIQPASTWSGGNITVKLNKGALSNLGASYLYVTDDAGAVNAQGFKLTGGTPPTNIPNPPEDVRVN